MNNKILHIMTLDKFLPPFIEFVNKYFNSNEHLFVVLGKNNDKFGKLDAKNIVFIDQKIKSLHLLVLMNRARKLILHGLWSHKLNQILFINPWFYKKCYWVMWGGDFYFPEKQSILQRYTIKKMGHFITYIKGDYELVEKCYGSKGIYHECFMYPSNLYKEYSVEERKHKTINIQVGNSADPTNNHLEVFMRLKKHKDKDINIFAPLSYGDKKYAKEVIRKGKEIFKDKFKPITEFMPFEKYLYFLGKIDIAIFAHERQQAMGNIITLLGLGKKVYIRSDLVSWSFFKKHKLNIYDIDTIKLDNLSNELKIFNKMKIEFLFSKEVLIMRLQKVFYE